MADLSSFEKLKLEKLFEMGSGYVLDFSNRTFSQFILDNTGIDIYDDKYMYETGSKANRLRAFWQKEPNHVVGNLLFKLLEYWKITRETYYSETDTETQSLYKDCIRIAERLQHDGPLEHIEAIQPVVDDKNFAILRKTIKDSIRNNEPEVALDRLHTFVVKYVRQLSDKHGIGYDRKRPLHSLFGQYVKYLRQKDLIESPMTERILKVSISILEAFNDVRNKQSLAHDNPILNYSESMLIYNSVTSTIQFLQAIEGEKPDEQDGMKEVDSNDEWDNIPF